MSRTIYSEICFIPMCTKKGKRWFAVRCLDWTAKDAKAKFLENDTFEWSYWRKEGWRIVKVKVITS